MMLMNIHIKRSRVGEAKACSANRHPATLCERAWNVVSLVCTEWLTVAAGASERGPLRGMKKLGMTELRRIGETRHARALAPLLLVVDLWSCLLLTDVG